MAKCRLCRKEIKLIRINGELEKVEPNLINFVPSESSRAELFLTYSGQRRYGVRITDGLRGYKVHRCKC